MRLRRYSFTVCTVHSNNPTSQQVSPDYILFAGFMMRLADLLFRDSPPDVRQRKLRVLLVVVVTWLLVAGALAVILLMYNKPSWR